MALTGQTDRRTGTACAYEAEARWDPKRRQSRYGRRRLVGHVDPRAGEVVPNRPTRAPASSPESRRELLGACALLDAVADESGVAAALRRALPRSWRRALMVAYYMVCEGSAPPSGLPRFCATHATPDGAPIAPRAVRVDWRAGARRVLLGPRRAARAGRSAPLRHDVDVVVPWGPRPGQVGPRRGRRSAAAGRPGDARRRGGWGAAVLPQGGGHHGGRACGGGR